MKPLRKGVARTGLAEGLRELAAKHVNGAEDSKWPSIERMTQLQAAVLGGAIEESLREIFRADQKRMSEVFWRLTNENLWRLTRALEASGLLLKAGE